MKLTTLSFPGLVLVMCTIFLSLGLLVPCIAHAVPVPGPDISDTLTVTFDGTPYTRTLDEGIGESVTDEILFTFSTGTSNFKSNDVYLIEPGTLTGETKDGLLEGDRSDVVTLQVQQTGQEGGTTKLHFTLNSDQDPGQHDHRFGVVETGQLQDITDLLLSGSTLGGHTLTVLVASDVEAAPVPEPATMLLLGSGLIGLAGLARRKFKK